MDREIMKYFAWRLIAASSFLMISLAAAETRPQYGGTLHVAIRETPATLDPSLESQVDSLALRNLTLLIFDTLVTVDNHSHLQPELALSWQATSDNRRWQFRLRSGVKFHDGSGLVPELAAASLRVANPAWNVAANGDMVVIELSQPDRELPAQLALAKNAIAKKAADGTLAGTGPFRITEWDADKKLTLAANEDYWRGRPFLDSIEVEMGRNPRDQLTALELGHSDLIEVAPEQLRHISADGRRASSSEPIELGALLFSRAPQSEEEKLLRSALALSVDRAAIRNVLLQGAGQPAGGILPNWMSGYAFVLSSDVDLIAARRQIAQVQSLPTWTIGYDTNDPLSRVIAERIVLNAHDAGLKLQVTAGRDTDIRLLRIPLASSDPRISLQEVEHIVGLPIPKESTSSIESLYQREQALLSTQKLIPLFHVPESYGIASTIKNLSLSQDGIWNLADVWLTNNKP